MVESDLHYQVSNSIKKLAITINRSSSLSVEPDQNFNYTEISKEDIVKTVISGVRGAHQEIVMTMLLAEEIKNPLPSAYHALILEKLKEGVSIRRLGFGNEEDFGQVVDRLGIRSPNFRFDRINNISYYQRMILIDKNTLFFASGEHFLRSDDLSLIELFLRYSNSVSDK